MTPEVLFWSALCLLGLLGSAVCSGMETGYYRLNRVTLALRSEREAGARLLRGMTDKPQGLLASLLIGNNAFNYIGVLGLTALLEMRGYSEASIVLLNALVLTPVVLVFCESTPKELFRRRADAWMYPLARPLWVMRTVFAATGFLGLVVGFARLVGRIGGIAPEPALSRREEVAALLYESASEGVISESQLRIVQQAMRLGRADVRRVMVPWRRVLTVDAGSSREEALAVFAEAVHTRAPVVDSSGSVVGVLNRLHLHAHPDRTIESLMTPGATLHPQMRVTVALARLREADSPVGIVMGPAGPVGLVTPKNLIEPLVGTLEQW